MTITQGDLLPAIELTDADGAPLPLQGFRGKPLVLYFYPKDDTSGCTREAQDFTAGRAKFDTLGAQILGVSKDPPAKHRKFIDKYQLTIRLASDETGAAMEAFGVWVEKSLYGKTYMGIERATFLFDASGVLVRAWRKVRVPGHVDQVLVAVEALQDPTRLSRS